jgi:hypothetical protein
VFVWLRIDIDSDGWTTMETVSKGRGSGQAVRHLRDDAVFPLNVGWRTECDI